MPILTKAIAPSLDKSFGGGISGKGGIVIEIGIG